MNKKQYISPLCKVVRYAPLLNNSWDAETESGLISVSGGEVDASLGESNQLSNFEEDTDNSERSVWED
ncbi:MAG: hypothetical protein IKX36_11350 [Prevotella sp.]|nr:hypothetical protein [Prevotella sp.]